MEVTAFDVDKDKAEKSKFENPNSNFIINDYNFIGKVFVKTL